MQSYGSTPPRVGSVAPGTKTGLVGKAMGNTTVKKDPNRISVKAHTRMKSGKK
jgi:hypothetical protein